MPDTKTLQLQKLVKSKLDTISGTTYHGDAPDDANRPYKTFEVRTTDAGDMARDDHVLTIDIWDKAKDWKAVDTIADRIEALFNNANFPQGTILPTFFKGSRYPVLDDDKQIKHVQMIIYIQNYERT